MDADIDKCAEVGDVGDGPFQNHPRQQIVHGLYAVCELRCLKLRTRVAARFFQLFDDVGHGRHAELLVGEIDRFQVAQRVAVAHQVFECLLGRCQYALNHRVGFRVNG